MISRPICSLLSERVMKQQRDMQHLCGKWKKDQTGNCNGHICIRKLPSDHTEHEGVHRCHCGFEWSK